MAEKAQAVAPAHGAAHPRHKNLAISVKLSMTMAFRACAKRSVRSVKYI